MNIFIPEVMHAVGTYEHRDSGPSRGRHEELIDYFVNLNGNGPRRINPNDAAGMPEAPEAFFLKQLSLGNRWIQS